MCLESMGSAALITVIRESLLIPYFSLYILLLMSKLFRPPVQMLVSALLHWSAGNCIALLHISCCFVLVFNWYNVLRKIDEVCSMLVL